MNYVVSKQRNVFTGAQVTPRCHCGVAVMQGPPYTPPGTMRYVCPDCGYLSLLCVMNAERFLEGAQA